MRRFSTFAFAIFFIALVGCKKTDLTSTVAASDNIAEPSLSAGKSGPSANGQGTLTVGTETRHFSFHAKTAFDGSVSGSGVLTYTAGGNQTKFDIDCMIVSGNVATMSGVVVTSDVIPVGYPVWFQAVDNGEGANAVEDQITLLTYYINGAPIPCTTPFVQTLNTVEGGSIQVKP